MLSLFPGLLFLAPLATTLVRIAAGLAFACIAYRLTMTREEISHAKLPIVGHATEWMIWLAALVTFATAVLLIVGLWTQAAAILGMLIALKHGIGTRRYAAIIPLSGGAYFLLFIICLSLLFSGAGALGVDLPL
jgi:uncharacterized membrane protein YphA (DoxX/SURF4 family)